jgi:hypothetical protein
LSSSIQLLVSFWFGVHEHLPCILVFFSRQRLFHLVLLFLAFSWYQEFSLHLSRCNHQFFRSFYRASCIFCFLFLLLSNQVALMFLQDEVSLCSVLNWWDQKYHLELEFLVPMRYFMFIFEVLNLIFSY